jgi:hypothetical protein
MMLPAELALFRGGYPSTDVNVGRLAQVGHKDHRSHFNMV